MFGYKRGDGAPLNFSSASFLMCAAKAESVPTPAATDKGAAAPAEPVKAGGKGIAALVPLIAVIVLAPVMSWAVAQFVLLPQLKKELVMPIDAQGPPEAEVAHEEPAEAHGEAKEHKGKKGEAPSAANTYEFANVVVNLAGTMGTRYLKTTFIVTGSDRALRSSFENNKPKLLDITLNVLSALTLADLEEPGAKNLLREKLLGAYNQALGKKVVEQVYFSDFVVQ